MMQHFLVTTGQYQFIQLFLNFLRKSCSTDWLNSWTCIISYTLITLDSVIAPNYHSTALALIDLISNISSATDRNEWTSAGIFLDLSKAFHAINHKILCQNYNTMAFGTLLCRGSKARIGLNLSSLGPINLNYRKISCDLPQGSVPGTLLFIIFS